MSRLSVLAREDMTKEQGEEYDQFVSRRPAQPDGTLGGPFDPWLRNPEFSNRIRGMAGMLWTRTSLDRGIVELAISITARFWRSNVEWAAHAPIAVQNGIGQDVIDSVMEEQRPDDAPAPQPLVYDICMALHVDHGLSEELFAQAVEAFGEQGLMEITAVIGCYTLVSMTLNTFEIPVAEGVETPFER